MVANTLQRVRELQEQIRAQEELLKQLTQTPEYVAESQFIQDVQDVLEMHGRTLREAVMVIDPSLLAPTGKPGKKPAAKASKPAAAPVAAPFAPTDTDDDTKAPEGATESAPKPQPHRKSRAGQGMGPAQRNQNAKRNAERRAEMIRAGRWFLFTNPHTGETCEASKANNDTLRAWVAQYGRGTVDKWKRPLTPEEAAM
jgi:hypothetical protein